MLTVTWCHVTKVSGKYKSDGKKQSVKDLDIDVLGEIFTSFLIKGFSR